MNKRNQFLIIFLGIVILHPLSAEEPLKSLFSFDINYARIGLSNNGWGLGVSYERLLMDQIAAKGKFAHMTFKYANPDIYCTTVNLALAGQYYFLENDLDKLYAELGCGTDFYNFFGDFDSVEQGEEIIYAIIGTGYKFRFLERFMLEINLGYHQILNKNEYMPNLEEFGRYGFQFRTSFRFNLGKNRKNSK